MLRNLYGACISLFMFMFLGFPHTVQATENTLFQTNIEKMIEGSYGDKEEAIAELSSIKDRRVIPTLQAMLDSRLYYRKQDNRIVILQIIENKYQITDVLTGEEYGQVDRHSIEKVRVNNRLRRILRAAIAKLSLGDEDVHVRRQAATEYISHMDDSKAELLHELLKSEKDSKVREAMLTGIALVDVNSDDISKRMNAIHLLGESLMPQARQRLLALLERNDKGEYIETDSKLIEAASKALSKIETQRKIYDFLETTFFGLSLGSVLLLIAIGLAITFGVMGVINMAHGELMMLGAYTTYVTQQLMPNYIDYSLFVAIPAAFVVAGLFGVAIERGVIRFLYGRPLETLLATFGISLVLQQLVRSIFSPLNRSVATPSWMSGSWEVNGVFALTYNRLYIILFGIMVFVFLMLLLKKTSLGLQVRAVSQNRPMAKAMGVRSEWVDALTFGLGSGIAGVAGVALSQLTNVGPNLGQAYIIDSFMVVVFGGVGNLWGTLVGALSLGVVNKYLEPWAGAVLAKILVLVFIILFIQKRPRGLFPQKGRAAEN